MVLLSNTLEAPTLPKNFLKTPLPLSAIFQHPCYCFSFIVVMTIGHAAEDYSESPAVNRRLIARVWYSTTSEVCVMVRSCEITATSTVSSAARR